MKFLKIPKISNNYFAKLSNPSKWTFQGLVTSIKSHRLAWVGLIFTTGLTLVLFFYERSESLSKNLTDIDNELQKLDPNSERFNELLEEMRPFHEYEGVYYYYKALELTRNNNSRFPGHESPLDYLKKIQSTDRYYIRSLILRRNILLRKASERNKYLSGLSLILKEMQENGFGNNPWYFRFRLEFENDIVEEYRAFHNSRPFITDNSYSIYPAIVYKSEEVVDLPELSQIAALNFIYLTRILNNSTKSNYQALARHELNRLYSTDESLKVVRIGMNELGIDHSNLSVDILKLEKQNAILKYEG